LNFILKLQGIDFGSQISDNTLHDIVFMRTHVLSLLSFVIGRKVLRNVPRYVLGLTSLRDLLWERLVILY
jgi:hypothetical protein